MPPVGYPFAGMAGEDWFCVPFCQAAAPAQPDTTVVSQVKPGIIRAG